MKVIDMSNHVPPLQRIDPLLNGYFFGKFDLGDIEIDSRGMEASFEAFKVDLPKKKVTISIRAMAEPTQLTFIDHINKFGMKQLVLIPTDSKSNFIDCVASCVEGTMKAFDFEMDIKEIETMLYDIDIYFKDIRFVSRNTVFIGEEFDRIHRRTFEKLALENL